MNSTKTSNLSFYNEQGILILTAKQFDTGRKFVFHIMDNDVPFDLSGCTAYLRIAKADGTQFQGHECCTVEGSQIIISTSAGNGSQILAAAGTNVCELHLKDANDIGLTTWTFHIVVEPRVHDGSHMSSIDSYDVLDNMINMEKERIANEEQRKENEKQRKENETNRNTVFEEKIEETNAVITDCHLVIDAANQKISSFDAEINEIVDGITDEAQSYADNAKSSETNAENAASSAANSAATASQKAGDAAASAVLSQSYAVGGTGTRDGEDADNAKEYAKQAKASAHELREKYILKTEKGASEGVATLDSDGKIHKGQLPDNIGNITGVKGDKESAYRTGDVNITPENIGALSASAGYIGDDDEYFSYSGWGFQGTGNQSISDFGTINARMVEGGELYYNGEDTDNRYARADEDTEINGEVRCDAIEARSPMIITNGLVSGLAAGTAKMFSNGLVISNPATPNDQGWIRVTGTDETDTILEIATGDDGNAGHSSVEEIVERQYGTDNLVFKEAKLLDKNGNTSFPGQVTAPNALITGNLRLKGSGNYGNKLNFGDGEYTYLHEDSDDHLVIHASNGIDFDSDSVTIRGAEIGSGIYALNRYDGASETSSGSISYNCLRYNNGFMILELTCMAHKAGSPFNITFPYTFIDSKNTVVMYTPFGNFGDGGSIRLGTDCGSDGYLRRWTSNAVASNSMVRVINRVSNGNIIGIRLEIAGGSSLYGESAHPFGLIAMGRWK